MNLEQSSQAVRYSLSRYFDPVQDWLLTFLDEVTVIVTSI
jgi:hypothetical protein